MKNSYRNVDFNSIEGMEHAYKIHRLYKGDPKPLSWKEIILSKPVLTLLIIMMILLEFLLPTFYYSYYYNNVYEEASHVFYPIRPPFIPVKDDVNYPVEKTDYKTKIAGAINTNREKCIHNCEDNNDN